MKWILVFMLLNHGAYERHPQDPYPTHEACVAALTQIARGTALDGFYRCEPQEDRDGQAHR